MTPVLPLCEGATVQWSPADERFHEPEADRRWRETWRFDFAAADASFGGWVELTRWPNANRSSYHAFFVGRGRPVLAVVDDEVRLGTKTLEFRADGLWADHICETPFEHWTIGLEAYALAVDDPAEVVGRGFGDLIGLGFDLEWECEEPPQGVAGGYRQRSLVTGEILVGDEEIDFVGTGSRGHWWGVETPVPVTRPDEVVATTQHRIDGEVVESSFGLTGGIPFWS